MSIAAQLPAGAANAPSSPPVLLVRDLAKAYLRDRARDAEAGIIGATHLTRLRYHLRSLHRRRKWGRIPAAEFTPATARRWLRYLQRRLKSSHSIDGAYRVLRAMLEWALSENLLDKSPIRGFKKFWPPCQPRGACSPAEFAALMAAAKLPRCKDGPAPASAVPGDPAKKPWACRNPACKKCRNGRRGKCKARKRRRAVERRKPRPSSLRFRLQMWALWHVGCRTCELRTARWEQLDLARGLVVMQEGKTTRKTGKPRVIPLSDQVLRVLRWMTRRGRPTTGFIFSAQGGRPIQRRSWERLFATYRKLAGLRDGVTPYTLRHGFCVQALECGLLSETEIAMIMGHSSTRLIQWYGRDLEKKTDHLRAKAGLVHRPLPGGGA